MVLQACDDAGITWADGEKTTEWFPFKTYPLDIGFFKEENGITQDHYNLYEKYELENITDWFFNAIKNNDSKLTPQNAEQEHLVQVLLAKMQGMQVEYKVDDNDWCLAGPDCVSLDIKYRIAPQPTPLITREMWAMIDPKWKWAAMDSDGEVYFYTDEPCIRARGFSWDSCGGYYCNSVLATNANSTNWRLSLTERPEDV